MIIKFTKKGKNETVINEKAQEARRDTEDQVKTLTRTSGGYSPCWEELNDRIEDKINKYKNMPWMITDFDCPGDPEILDLGNGIFGIDGIRSTATIVPSDTDMSSYARDRAIFCEFRPTDMIHTEKTKDRLKDLVYGLLYDVKNENAVYNDHETSPDADYELFTWCNDLVEELADCYGPRDREYGMVSEIKPAERVSLDGKETYIINGREYVLVKRT